MNSTFEPSSDVNLPIKSTFPASILTLAPLWNTQPSIVTLPGVLTANVAPFSMLMFYSHFFLVLMVDSYDYSMYLFALVAVIKSTIPDRNNGNFSSQKAAPIGVEKSFSINGMRLSINQASLIFCIRLAPLVSQARILYNSFVFKIPVAVLYLKDLLSIIIITQ